MQPMSAGGRTDGAFPHLFRVAVKCVLIQQDMSAKTACGVRMRCHGHDLGSVIQRNRELVDLDAIEHPIRGGIHDLGFPRTFHHLQVPADFAESLLGRVFGA